MDVYEYMYHASLDRKVAWFRKGSHVKLDWIVLTSARLR